MKTDDVRESFLSFFESKGHKRLPSDSLIPLADPTLLFTGAGMNQFKEYFMGLKKDLKRATTAQKCLRTGDLDNVGRTSYHHSFFEMLGNFSFGDYFKEEAIHWAWEYLTDRRWLGIPKDRFRVSVHEKDREAFEIWEKKIGIRPEWITRLGDDTNFWPANAPQDGPDGPCGPCSEIYFDQGPGYAPGTENDTVTSSSGRFAEIWNLVFTQYDRKGAGNLVPLEANNIDTGAGLERLSCILQGKRSNYEIDIFQPALKRLGEIFPQASEKDRPSLYRITDHVRAVYFAISDGALPSNEGRGYVIRKLIRRALWHGWRLGIREAFLHRLAPCVTQTMSQAYPELKDHEESVTETIEMEEDRFLNTLETGVARLEEEIARHKQQNQALLSGEQVFRLYDTYGFPLDLTKEISELKGIRIDEQGFDRLMGEQRDRARKSSQIAGAIFVKTELDEDLMKLPPSRFLGYHDFRAVSRVLFARKVGEELWVVLEETPFYGESGGQIGDRGRIFGGQFEGEVFDAQKKRDIILHRLKVWRGELKEQEAVTAEVEEGTRRDVVRHHSATHLLQQALRFVLGEQVRQLGSLVSEEKLRFDFSFPRALTPEEIERVEREVNKRVLENYPTQTEITDLSSAKQKGALAFFGEKYGGEVRLVTMGESRELCGGTHVRATGDIGLVKILSESSVSSGVRRIEAVAGLRAYDLISKNIKVVEGLGSKFKVPPEEIIPRIEKLETRLRELEKGTREAREATPLLETSWPSGKYEVVLKALRDVPPNKLKEMCDALRQGRKDALFILSSEAEGRLSIVVGLNPETAKDGPDSNLLVKKIAARMGGTGGGRKDLAQGGGNIPANYESFVEFIRNEIKALCK